VDFRSNHTQITRLNGKYSIFVTDHSAFILLYFHSHDG
jgi:hypothetical protein